MRSAIVSSSGYGRLEVYRRAMALVPEVEALIRRLPGSERYELASQLRRATRSAPTNIAEGYAKRRSAKEFSAYLTTAMASANEVEVHLKIAAELGYMAPDEYDHLAGAYNIVGRQLYRLIASWRQGVPATSNKQLATKPRSRGHGL